jgi:hypothetical protein
MQKKQPISGVHPPKYKTTFVHWMCSETLKYHISG